MKVVVGMSGGVDSSVAAYLLKEQGYEVEGLSFILYEARLRQTFPGCCSRESIEDAGRTAERIGIAHSVIDLRTEFMTRVIEPFIDCYARGMTPNPCVFCNRHIKFPHLLEYAREMQAGFISTGHYARAERGPQGVCLKKGVDEKKDQSYVLYVLNPEELDSLVLPLGEKRKDEVREIARMRDLPAAKRPESQEICFVEDGDCGRFLDGLLTGERGPGPIVHSESGRIVGTHKGIYSYTIGQRKGLGISSPEPLYVVEIDAGSDTVYVGPRDAARSREFLVDDVNWLVRSGDAPLLPAVSCRISSPFRATVKVRSMMKDEPATISFVEGVGLRVYFDEPQWAPAPGQSAVFYEGDTVLGGGTISVPVSSGKDCHPFMKGTAR